MNYSRCIYCQEVLTRDLIALRVRTCGRCCQLRRELSAAIVEPPSREPGSDDEPSHFTQQTIMMDGRDFKAHAEGAKASRDGKWLAEEAAKRGKTQFFYDYGHTCGFPRDIRRWSPGMVDRAIQAIQAKKANAQTSAS